MTIAELKKRLEACDESIRGYASFNIAQDAILLAECYRDVAILQRTLYLNYGQEPTLVTTHEFIDKEAQEILEGEREAKNVRED